MPEPLSIATGVISIVFNCIKGLEIAKEYVNKYNSAELKILELATECKALHVALINIQNVFASGKFRSTQLRDESTTNAVGTFEEVFGTCQLAFSILYERLKPLLSPSFKQDNTMAIKSKIAAVWNNSDIDQLMSLIRGLIPAVQLLITAFQTESVLETNQILTTNDAHRIFNRVASDTQSLVSTRREQSIATQSRVEGTESVIGDEEFAFDDSVIDSRAYRRALQGYLRSQNTVPSQSPRTAYNEDNPPSAQDDSESTQTRALMERSFESESLQQFTNDTELQAPTVIQPPRSRASTTKSLYRNLFRGSRRRQKQAIVSGDSASDRQVVNSENRSDSVRTSAADPWEEIQGLIKSDGGETRRMPASKEDLDDQVSFISALIEKEKR